MLIVHTSDWHLGQNLYEQSRLDEQKCFLQWLKSLIQERQADVLLVSGDIYDTSAPPNAARKLYYDFLRSVRDMPGGICRHVILTGGNHDSPSVLNASAQYLESDNIHVIGRAPDFLKDEVLLLRDADDEPYMIVCAVPYLREADLDRTHFGTDPAKRDEYIARAVLAHYEEVAAEADRLNAELPHRVPVIGMGHLFARGVLLKRDGEGQVVCGTLGEIDAGLLSGRFDYLALGHIHSPRIACGTETIRYSGSPLAMDFGESQPEKKIVLIELKDDVPGHTGGHAPGDTDGDAKACSARASGWQGTVHIEEVPVPCFRQLIQLQGNSVEELESRVQDICTARAQTAEDAGDKPDQDSHIQELAPWLLIDYTGPTPPADWRERIEAKTRPSPDEKPLCTLAAMRDYSLRKVSWRQASVSDLKALEPADVFELVLESYDVEDEQKDMLRSLFQQLSAGQEEQDDPDALEAREELEDQREEQLEAQQEEQGTAGPEVHESVEPAE